MTRASPAFFSADQIRPVVARLLEQLEVACDFIVTPLSGGANNRGCRIEAAGQAFFLKWYFSDPLDPRDRCGTELGFTQFLWEHGIHRIAQPLAFDLEHGVGLFAYLQGRRLAPGEVTRSRVQESVDFVCAMNRYRETPAARALPAASEACFSLAEHLGCTAGRVRAVAEAADDAGEETRRFVLQQLVPAWDSVSKRAEDEMRGAGLVAGDRLPGEARILSPSDFGFHNTLVDAQGELQFLDFEYAGWDDPAKLVCDFFCQVEVPVPREFFDLFAEGVLAGHPGAELHRGHIRILKPVYKIKWCCIVLNQLVRAGRRRRQFSGAEEEHAAQLNRAMAILAGV